MITILHGAIGVLLVVLAVYLLVGTKGNVTHRMIGYVYVIVLCVVVSLGLYIAIAKGIGILIAIGVLTLLQCCMGIRALYNKEYLMGYFDFILLVMFILACVGLFAVGTASSIAMGCVYVCLLVMHVYYLCFKEHKEPLLWLSQHISHMIGTIISAITALLIGAVGALNYIPVFWVVPTIVFILVVRKLRLKYAPIRAMYIGRLKW